MMMMMTVYSPTRQKHKKGEKGNSNVNPRFAQELKCAPQWM
jgi:hypothetical protein